MNFYEFQLAGVPKSIFFLQNGRFFQAAIGGHAHWRAGPKAIFFFKMVSFSRPPPRSSQGLILSAQGVSLSVLGVILSAPGLILIAPGLILSAPGLILSAPGTSV